MKFSRPEYWSGISLLQRIFATQGLNPGLPHCRHILYQLSHKESLRILEWVAYPFSRGSSQPRNQTGVSCTLKADSLPAELSGKPRKDRIKGKGEQPDEEIHRARPERVPSAGAPVLMELGCATLRHVEVSGDL